eukprot:Nk52_evm12s2612 gene=Nk52_evmTU12s2612
MTGIPIVAQNIYVNNILKNLRPANLKIHPPLIHAFSWKEERDFPLHRTNDIFHDNGAAYELWMQAHHEFYQSVAGSLLNLLIKKLNYHQDIGYDTNDNVYARVEYTATNWRFGLQSSISIPFILPGRSHLATWKTINDARMTRIAWFHDPKSESRTTRLDLCFEGWWSKSTEVNSCGYLTTVSNYQDILADKKDEAVNYNYCVVGDKDRYAHNLDYKA